MNRQTIEKQRQLRFDEINSLFDEISDKKFSAKELKTAVKDKWLDFWVDGWASGILVVGDKKMPDPYQYFDKKYKDGTVYEKLEKYSEEIEKAETDNARQKAVNALKRLADSEANRIYNEGVIASAKAETQPESQPKKVWRTQGDERVRETHWYLEGDAVGIDEEFITYTGDSAQAPGMFSDEENNANCRCYITLKK